jgi:hypothetical protein
VSGDRNADRLADVGCYSVQTPLSGSVFLDTVGRVPAREGVDRFRPTEPGGRDADRRDVGTSVMYR